MTTMSFSELWKHFRLLTDPDTLTAEEKKFLDRFLQEEYLKRQQRRIQHLMAASGIKRIKLLNEFDWKFNPKIPRDKILEYMNTQWLKAPSNLVLIGPAGANTPKQVISARHRFARRQYEHEFKWKPSRKVEDAIVAAILS